MSTLKYSYFVPEAVSARQVEQIVRHSLECPYCKAERTNCGVDIGWVISPLRQSEPRWICLGCCIDIYSTCLKDEFQNHPYYDLVEDIAKLEGLNVSELRKIALIHQFEIAGKNLPDNVKSHYLKKIQNLLLSIEVC